VKKIIIKDIRNFVYVCENYFIRFRGTFLDVVKKAREIGDSSLTEKGAMWFLFSENTWNKIVKEGDKNSKWIDVMKGEIIQISERTTFSSFCNSKNAKIFLLHIIMNLIIVIAVIFGFYYFLR